MKNIIVAIICTIFVASCSKNNNIIDMPGLSEITDSNNNLEITRACMSQPANSTGGTESSSNNILWNSCSGYTCNVGFNNVAGVCVSTASCPTNYVKIAANSSLSLPAFCISKYEMKAVDNSGTLFFNGYNNGVALDVSLYKPESRPDGIPWVKMSYSSMRNECASIGTGYHLSTLAEWQAMALEIESVSSNYQLVNGEKYYAQGNSDGTISASAIADGYSVAGTKLLSAVEGSPYVGTGNSNSDSWNAGGSQKRTYSLLNGDEVWDVSGNAREIVDIDGLGGTISYTNPSASGFYEISNSAVLSTIQSMTTTNFYSLNMDFVEPLDSTLLDANNKIGRLYISSGARTQRIMSRGGNFGGNFAGIFSGDLDQAFDGLSGSGGFRCVVSL